MSNKQQPIILLPGETINILGVDLIIESDETLDCEGCVLHVTEIVNILCGTVDCGTNQCIISNNIK